jgi:hypothetical protein
MAEFEQDAVDDSLRTAPGFRTQITGPKTKRNGLTQLPNELLIRIAAYLVRAAVPDLPYDFLALTAVCMRLRLLYISTPELWTRISTDWDEAILEDFLARAAAYPLHLVVNSTDADGGCQVLQSKCLHRAKTLQITLRDEEDDANSENDANNEEDDDNTSSQAQEVMRLLRNTDAPGLRQLVLYDAMFLAWSENPGWMMELDVPSDASCVGLTSLKLLSIHVITMPALPALRSLDMNQCSVPPESFHAALFKAPKLEHLYLRSSLLHELTDKPTPPMERVALHSLRYLFVQSIALSVASMIDMLPDPSEAFLVIIEREGDSRPWSSTTGAHASVLARLTHFWNSKTGSSNLPRGQFICDSENPLIGYHNYISLGARPSNKGFDCYPAVYYYAPCNAAARDDPLIDTVHAVHFKYPFPLGSTRTRIGDSIIPGAGHPKVLSLQQAEKVVIQYLRPENVPSWMTEALEAWLVSRLEPGSSLRSIEFRGCAKTARPLFERIEGQSSVHNVTWIYDIAPEVPVYACRGDFDVL